MKSIILKLLNKFGYEISKSYSSDGSYDPFCDIELGSKKIVDLEALANISVSIPGMVSPKSGQFLYTMCYMQQLKGDVVEIGSWQGRSTSFLARAVSNSKNGNFYAIDHFKGNIGKEKLYAVGKNDLSDLESNFLSNMERVGLSDSVKLLNMPNEQAERVIKDINIRFLFIDGDHSNQGVKKDIELFFPKLRPGSIVVFDDFSNYFQGLIEVVNLLLREQEFSRVMSYSNTLVLVV